MSVYWPFRVGVQGTPAIFFSFIYVLTTLLNHGRRRWRGTRREGVLPFSLCFCSYFAQTQREGGYPLLLVFLCTWTRRGGGHPSSSHFYSHQRDERGYPPFRRVSIQMDATRRGHTFSSHFDSHRHDERGYLPSRRVFIRTDTTYLHTMRRGLPSSSNNYNKLFIMLFNYIVNTPGTRTVPRVTPRRTRPEFLGYGL